jgi:hypothetical protein
MLLTPRSAPACRSAFVGYAAVHAAARQLLAHRPDHFFIEGF